MTTRIIASLALSLVLVTTAKANTLTVMNNNNSGAGSLRAALASAANGDVIDVTGVSGTILLTSGELLVTNSLFILGPGPAALAINGNHASRVFHIGSNTVVKIFTLTITNGLAAGTGFPDQAGGAIYNHHATLSVINCTVSGNSYTNIYAFGGAIYNDGRSGSATVTIVNCTLSSNTATNGASASTGAIYNDCFFGGTATVIIANSTVSGNSSSYDGGGIYNNGAWGGRATMTIASSTISSNSSSAFGGGIVNDGFEGSATLTVSNCIVSGNSAGNSGAIYNEGRSGSATLTIANSTLSSNSAGGTAGGIYNDGEEGNAMLTVSNCTLNGNAANSFGSAIYNEANFGGTATVTIANSTLSGNSVADGACIFNTNPGTGGTATVTIANSTISGNSGGGVYSEGNCCGSARLTIDNSTINSNSVFGFGGGVFNRFSSNATITNSTINGNSGGGVFNSGTLTIANSSISSNWAGAFGGGIDNNGWLTVSNSTLSSNTVIATGGGIYNSATLTIANSTVSGNSVSGGIQDGVGGGIYNDGASSGANLTIAHCTLSGNSAGAGGGGIYNDGSAGSATLEIGNTILKTGALGENIVNDSGAITSDGYNLSSDGGGGVLTAMGDQINTDPMLSPLQNNGGPTFTHALLPGSPAIDAGDPDFVSPPSFDQRGPGFPRVLANWSGSARIDIGAFEASPTDAVGDGIPDSWRAHYFGGNGSTTNSQSCAPCDTDGTGQNNLFKYTAGLDPTNPASVFVLKIANVSPTQKNLIFNPIASGRTYTPEFRTNLVSGSYAALSSFSGPVTNVNQVTVTDTNAVEPQKFYHVHISLP